MYSFFFFFVCFFLPFFGKCLKNHRVKNTRAFFGEREIQSTHRYKNEKVRAFEEDEDEDDSRFFFFGFFSKRRAMMMNNKTSE